MPSFYQKKKFQKKCDTVTLATHHLCRCVQCDQGQRTARCVGVPPQWTGSAVRVEKVRSVFSFFLHSARVSSLLAALTVVASALYSLCKIVRFNERGRGAGDRKEEQLLPTPICLIYKSEYSSKIQPTMALVQLPPIHLYRSMLRVSKQVNDYNFRSYAIRRVKTGWRLNQNLIG